MKSNILESAILSNETNDFFRGYGKYNIPSPDYEGHVHGAQMGGAARTYAEKSEVCSENFDRAFMEFLNSLSISKEDLNHFLANLSSYFAQKSRGGFPYSKLFETSSSSGSVFVKEYLNKIVKAPFFQDVKVSLVKHAAFINNKGFDLLIDIVNELEIGQ